MRIPFAALLALSAAACSSSATPVASPPIRSAAPSADVSPDGAANTATAGAPRTCAARVGSAPGQGWFPYAYGALSREMARLNQADGRFNVRRVLDRIADAFETLPDGDQVGTQAAAETVRAQVSRLIDKSGNQAEHADATRHALVETHAVLRRMAEGPCRGDAALMHRIVQLGEAVEAIPANEPRVPLLPVVTALQRAQAALLALSTSNEHRAWVPPAPAPPAVVEARQSH